MRHRAVLVGERVLLRMVGRRMCVVLHRGRGVLLLLRRGGGMVHVGGAIVVLLLVLLLLLRERREKRRLRHGHGGGGRRGDTRGAASVVLHRGSRVVRARRLRSSVSGMPHSTARPTIITHGPLHAARSSSSSLLLSTSAHGRMHAAVALSGGACPSRYFIELAESRRVAHQGLLKRGARLKGRAVLDCGMQNAAAI